MAIRSPLAVCSDLAEVSSGEKLHRGIGSTFLKEELGEAKEGNGAVAYRRAAGSGGKLGGTDTARQER